MDTLLFPFGGGWYRLVRIQEYDENNNKYSQELYILLARDTFDGCNV